jgi:ankyrin repeat protein
MSRRLLSFTLGLLLTAAAVGVPAQTTPDVTGVPAMNESPIHDAARLGTREEIERLLRESPQARDARTPLGATPLHYAAMNADSGPLKALLAAGANPNARDSEGRTPLHMAAFSIRTANAMLLLQGGADPMLKTNAGRDVLSLARKVRADELAGEISLWLLKGCKPGKAC